MGPTRDYARLAGPRSVRPEPLADVSRRQPGAGSPFGLDRFGERAQLGVSGRGLSQLHGDQRQDALAQYPTHLGVPDQALAGVGGFHHGPAQSAAGTP